MHGDRTSIAKMDISEKLSIETLLKICLYLDDDSVENVCEMGIRSGCALAVAARDVQARRLRGLVRQMLQSDDVETFLA